MSLSNERNALILCPSNKSEAAVGYATLYGDTVGALAPIKDLTKEKVFALARFLNKQAAQQSHTPPIPPEILTREPSAELHANQKDSDTLPTYPVLDALVQGFIEEGRSVADMVRQGWDPHATSWTFERILANEYKRRQAPFGLKVSACSLDEWLVPLSMQPVPLSDRQSANRQ